MDFHGFSRIFKDFPLPGERTRGEAGIFKDVQSIFVGIKLMKHRLCCSAAAGIPADSGDQI